MSKKKSNICILCNDMYGIYYGDVIKYNPVTQVATVAKCRHVAAWFGKTGGITSLATHGLCGDKASESLIGSPTERPATLTKIVNIFPVSKEAKQTFDKSIAHD